MNTAPHTCPNPTWRLVEIYGDSSQNFEMCTLCGFRRDTPGKTVPRLVDGDDFLSRRYLLRRP